MGKLIDTQLQAKKATTAAIDAARDSHGANKAIREPIRPKLSDETKIVSDDLNKTWKELKKEAMVDDFSDKDWFTALP